MLKQKRLLILSSVFLNAILFCVIVYFVTERQTVTVIVESSSLSVPEFEVKSSSFGYFSRSVSSSSIEEYIARHAALCDRELIDCFMDPAEEISCGITNKDIIASWLIKRGVAIDVPLKSIGKWPQTTIPISYSVQGKDDVLNCFVALTPDAISTVQEYLVTEKIPYTSRRLFELIRDPSTCHQSLIDVFQRRQEWFEMRHAFLCLFRTDERLLMYLKLLSWEGLEAHLALAQEMNRSREQPNGASAEKHAHIAGDVVLLLLADFKRTKSSDLSQAIITMCPPSLLIKLASGDLIVQLFDALPSKPSQETLIFALEVVQHPSREELFQSVCTWAARSFNAPFLQGVKRADFIKVMAPLASSDAAAFEKTVVKLQTLSAKKPNRALAQGLHGSSKQSHAPCESTAKSAIQAKNSKETLEVQQNLSSPENAKDVKVKSPPIPQSSSHASIAPQIASRQAKEKLMPYILYTVRKGDTLWSISKRFGISVDKIRYLNKIRGNTLPPGLVLKIPK